MEHVDCNKNHLRYKLTQYLSHLICKSNLCILINIGSLPFKLELNLQPEQGEKKWSVVLCEANEGVISLLRGYGVAQENSPSKAQHQSTKGDTQGHPGAGATLSTKKTPIHKGWVPDTFWNSNGKAFPASTPWTEPGLTQPLLTSWEAAGGFFRRQDIL